MQVELKVSAATFNRGSLDFAKAIADTIDRNFRTTWRGRGQENRDTIATLCARALDADAEFQRIDVLSRAVDADATALITRVGGQEDIGEELQLGRWQQVLNRAVDALNEFLTAQTIAADTWNALAQEHTAQNPHSDQASIDDATGRENTARNGIVATQARIATLTQDIEQPPVPANQITSIEKVLTGWLTKERLSRWRATTSTAAQGIDAIANRPWVAGNWVFKKHVGSGGQGSAQLWLFFDTNNTLQHVSRRTLKHGET